MGDNAQVYTVLVGGAIVIAGYGYLKTRGVTTFDKMLAVFDTASETTDDAIRASELSKVLKGGKDAAGELALYAESTIHGEGAFRSLVEYYRDVLHGSRARVLELDTALATYNSGTQPFTLSRDYVGNLRVNFG